MCHEDHGVYQQHESMTPTPPAKTLLLRTPTQTQEGQMCPQPTLTGMTTTWSNERTAPSGTFDSDSQVLMLDDGALACITNDKRDFIELPKRVDRKVKGIKGHANATH